ncbi:MAG TPA: flavodoxin family protein [Candidatus Methanomethylophilaceae archaeon]|nr:flavodoxin family protein [Candidatus Methanomethylophilaceae archaeon]
MKIIGIVGSRRRNGNTSLLVQEALKSFEGEGIETELLFLGDYNIKSCTGCEGCKDTFNCVIKDDMHKLYKLILDSDAVILGSPTYFYNVSGEMKLFLDRCYSFEVFDEDDRSVWMGINEVLGGKYAVVIAVCEQNNEEDMGYTADTMKRTLEALGYRVVDTVKALGLFKAGEASNNESEMEKARRSGEKLLKTLKLRKSLEEKLKSRSIY